MIMMTTKSLRMLFWMKQSFGNTWLQYRHWIESAQWETSFSMDKTRWQDILLSSYWDGLVTQWQTSVSVPASNSLASLFHCWSGSALCNHTFHLRITRSHILVGRLEEKSLAALLCQTLTICKSQFDSKKPYYLNACQCEAAVAVPEDVLSWNCSLLIINPATCC